MWPPPPEEKLDGNPAVMQIKRTFGVIQTWMVRETVEVTAPSRCGTGRAATPAVPRPDLGYGFAETRNKYGSRR
jgi:hypothetical protein